VIYEEFKLTAGAIACASCGAAATPEKIRSLEGACSACSSKHFTVTLIKEIEGADSEELDELPEQVGSLGALLKGELPQVGWEHRTEYVLEGVAGPTLLEWMALPAPQAWERVQAFRKEAAIRNLRPDQRVCPACQTPFAIAPTGPRSRGYCSESCESQALLGPADRRPISSKRPVPIPGARHGRKAIVLGLIGFGIALSVYSIVSTFEWIDWIGEKSGAVAPLDSPEQAQVRSVLEAWLGELKKGGTGTAFVVAETPIPPMPKPESWKVLDVQATVHRAEVRVEIGWGHPPGLRQSAFWSVRLASQPDGWKIIGVERRP